MTITILDGQRVILKTRVSRQLITLVLQTRKRNPDTKENGIS